jgi:hypothetical protein
MIASHRVPYEPAYDVKTSQSVAGSGCSIPGRVNLFITLSAKLFSRSDAADLPEASYIIDVAMAERYTEPAFVRSGPSVNSRRHNA